MAVDNQTLGAAMKYVQDTLQGTGALQGKNCTIQSIEPIDGGNKVTFAWTKDDGTVETASMTVMDGINGGGGGSVDLDTTLTKAGFAADAEAVGSELNKRAVKPLIINADNAPTTGANSSSGVPIFTIDYSPSDLKKHADSGGRVLIVRFNRHYEMYEATDTAAKFRFIESSDIQVDWYHAILDTNKAVTITKTTHKSRMETTTGAAVGMIPRIKSVDSRGYPFTWEFVNEQDLVSDVLAALPNGDEVSY